MKFRFSTLRVSASVIAALLLLGLMPQIAISADATHAGIDHLVPVPSAYNWAWSQGAGLGGDAFRRGTVYRALLEHGKPYDLELWMIAYPSFRPEYAIELQRIRSKDYAAKVVGYRLRWAEAIWPMQADKINRDWNKQPKIHADAVGEFPIRAAQEISKAWLTVLKQTRYDDNDVWGIDGTTYDFGAAHYVGETWSPQSGPPARLVELADCLAAYAQSSPSARPKLLDQCVQKAKDIEFGDRQTSAH